MILASESRFHDRKKGFMSIFFLASKCVRIGLLHISFFTPIARNIVTFSFLSFLQANGESRKS